MPEALHEWGGEREFNIWVKANCGLSCPSAGGILVPQPWMKPTSLSLEDGFFTTGPPGKSHVKFFLKSLFCKLSILPKQEGNA